MQQTNTTIRGWTSSSLRVESLSKVAKTLGCAVDDLLAEEEVKTDVL